MARKPQQKRSKDTVSAIVEAGFIAVAQRGISGTTTRHIADIAGIGVGSLYEYFENKEQIYAAMHQRFIQETVAMIQPELPTLVKMGIGDAVRNLLRLFGDFLQKNDGLYLKCTRHVIHSEISAYLEPVVQLLMTLMMQHIAHHPQHVPLRNLPTMSYIFINGGIFTVIKHLSDPNPPITFEELSEGLANMVSHFVEKEMDLSAPVVKKKSNRAAGPQ